MSRRALTIVVSREKQLVKVLAFLAAFVAALQLWWSFVHIEKLSTASYSKEQQLSPRVVNFNAVQPDDNTVLVVQGVPVDAKVALELENAAIDIETIDSEKLKFLPSWKKVESVLGSQIPTIVGLETCAAFKNSMSSSDDRYIGVSGMFNSGTNFLYDTLLRNCRFPLDNGDILYQVPWGKHSPSWEWNRRSAKDMEDYNKTRVLPIVIIRNPMEWMESMCRNSYIVEYPEDVDSSCPHMVDPSSGNLLPVEVGVKPPYIRYESIVHYWNLWCRSHLLQFPNPRLMIRLEDLTVRPKETLQAICECAGGKLKPKFRIQMENMKLGEDGHGGASRTNGYLEGWIRLGQPKAFPLQDYEAAKQHLDKILLDTFHFSLPKRAELAMEN